MKITREEALALLELEVRPASRVMPARETTAADHRACFSPTQYTLPPVAATRPRVARRPRQCGDAWWPKARLADALRRPQDGASEEDMKRSYRKLAMKW